MKINTVNVICATFNASNELIKTINSFNNQTYKDKRLIIIDGGSNDNFKDVINIFKKSIDYMVSEPDLGISDAFNKGIRQAQAGYVYFLGAGDTFFTDDALENLVKDTDYNNDLLVCGKIRRIDLTTNKLLDIAPKSKVFNLSSLLFRMSLPHQGLLTSTLFFDKYGLFRIDCKYAMDYELLLRAYHSFPKVIFKDIIVADWMSGGVGSGRIREVLREYNRIKEINQVAPKIILIGLNCYTILKYYIKEWLDVCKKS